MDPKYATKLTDLERRLLEQPGSLDTAVRRAAAFGGPLPDVVAEYVGRVHKHAYEVTDGDVEALKAGGHSEDQIFELTVAAAYGASRKRLDAGLAALDARTGAT